LLAGISDNTLWLPKNADWLIYQDRFHGTWFAGDWIVRQIKHLWLTWDRHIWTTMRYGYPARKPDGFQPMDGGCSHVFDDHPVPIWYRPPDW